jgi:hypothetical protein
VDSVSPHPKKLKKKLKLKKMDDQTTARPLVSQGDSGTGSTIILKYTYLNLRAWIGFNWLMTGLSGGLS